MHNMCIQFIFFNNMRIVKMRIHKKTKMNTHVVHACSLLKLKKKKLNTHPQMRTS